MANLIPLRTAFTVFLATMASTGAALAGPAPEAAKTTGSATSESAARGKALIDQFESRIQNANSITFASTMAVSGTDAGQFKPISLTVAYQKPNLLAIDLTQSGKDELRVFNAADGGYVVDVPGNRYAKLAKTTDAKSLTMPAMAAGMQMQPTGAVMGLSFPFGLIAVPHPLTLPQGPNTTIRAYDGTLNGVAVTHVTETLNANSAATILNLYVDRTTQAPVLIAFQVVKAGATIVSLRYAFNGFTIADTPLPASTFEYTPPATMTAFTPPAQP